MKNANEPARPLKIDPSEQGRALGMHPPKHYLGLTKREHFAGLAMQAFLAAGSYTNPHDVALLAKVSITRADALLKELDESTN